MTSTTNALEVERRTTAPVAGACAVRAAGKKVAAGLTEVAEVIDNGSATPGTSRPDCSSEFRRRFAEADLVIAKGQGNFETLHDVPAPLFGLFRVKCPRVADHCGHPIGSRVIWQAMR